MTTKWLTQFSSRISLWWCIHQVHFRECFKICIEGIWKHWIYYCIGYNIPFFLQAVYYSHILNHSHNLMYIPELGWVWTQKRHHKDPALPRPPSQWRDAHKHGQGVPCWCGPSLLSHGQHTPSPVAHRGEMCCGRDAASPGSRGEWWCVQWWTLNDFCGVRCGHHHKKYRCLKRYFKHPVKSLIKCLWDEMSFNYASASNEGDAKLIWMLKLCQLSQVSSGPLSCGSINTVKERPRLLLKAV